MQRTRERLVGVSVAGAKKAGGEQNMGRERILKIAPSEEATKEGQYSIMHCSTSVIS